MKRQTFWILCAMLLCTVSTTFVSAAKIGKVYGSYINIREEANHASKVIGKKLRGDTYEIMFDNGDGWLKVKFSDGTQGWIFNSVVEKQLAKSQETKQDSIAVASEPKKIVSVASEPVKVETKSPKKTETSPAKKPDKATKTTKTDKKASDETVTSKKSEKPTEKAKNTASASAEIATKAAMQKKPLNKDEVAGKVVTTSKTAEEYYHEAIELYDKKRYKEALEANRAALAQAPRNPEILNNIANCLFKLGKIQDAIETWKEALQIAPKQAKICNNLGIAYYQLDENDKAIEFYKKAILFDPQFADAYYNLASVYGFMGRFQDALDNYKKYLEFKPDSTMRKLAEERIEYCQKQLDYMQGNAKSVKGKRNDTPKPTSKADEAKPNDETPKMKDLEKSTSVATQTPQAQ